jgi:nucleotide-binding universal stress UspA family protein
MKSTSKKNSSKSKELNGGSQSNEFRLQRILVPIDFSEHSKNALNYAVSIAKQFHSELILGYVVESPIYPAEFGFGQVALPTAELEMEFRERGKKELEKLVRSHIKGQVNARTVVAEGPAATEILAIANKEQVDLVIIATHGHTGVEHLLFGSTTEKVVRKAPCPVLVVRAKK